MTTPWWDLTGKVALVTGAGSVDGIGMAAARALVDLGAAVSLTSTTDRARQRAHELTGEGFEAVGFACDLTDDEGARGLIDATVQHFGRLDILVNNAGMVSIGSSPESGDVEQMPVATWNAGISRNLDTCFITTRHALPHLRRQGWGRIVNVASVSGAVMAMRSDPAYAAAKAGMVGFTRALAMDCAGQGITVNAVAPGWIATASQTAKESREGSVTPLRRSGSPQEVAAAIAWLCTPGASYVTGTCLVVDGGNSIAEERLAT